MQTKLTLRLDSDLIEQAKREAEARGVSLSRMVAEYFSGLKGAEKTAEPLPPVTASLVGIGRGMKIKERDYLAYLEQKHR